jgi:ABC-type dipeptide/oligopeptide/nickel transport system ATPase subunit
MECLNFFLKIKSYILSDSVIPFTVVGQSGSGKTSVLGKAISLVSLKHINFIKKISVNLYHRIKD